jgi:DNA primase
MPLIPDAVIDEIQARVDIAELIGRYVPLKRTGRHFKALCPFHREKTPSFIVNTDKQIFHCFGCGAGGNIFSFLIQHDRLTFPEAVRQLADHVGVPLPDREAVSRNGSLERYRTLMEKVCGYFERRLAHPQQGAAGRAYLEQRGVTPQTQQAFRLGLAPAGWDHLLKAARPTGVSPDDLETVGLLVRGSSGLHDRFRNRLIFPILDVRGRVVGFGGRSLDDQEPKYLNSPETPLYTKGRHLFGLAQAREAIVAHKTAVLVEGYFDCVVLAGGGIAHVVSPLGTALTVDQARLLKRYAERVILAFDADAAGETATLRGIDVLVETGLHVQVAQLPGGVDPDDYLRVHGRPAFEQLLEGSLTIFDFLLETARRRYPVRVAEGKVDAAQLILPTIARVPNAILRREYVRLLAERLRLDEAAVTEELAHVRSRSAVAAERLSERRMGPAPARAAGPERLLTALIVDEPSRWAQVRDRVALEQIANPALRRILEMVAELVEGRHVMTPAQLVSRLTADGHGALVTELISLAQSVAPKDEAIADCLRRIGTSARARKLEQLRTQIQTAQDAGQEQQLHEMLAEYQQLVKGGAGHGATHAQTTADQ